MRIWILISVLAVAGLVHPFSGCTAGKPMEEGFAIYLIDESGPPDEAPNLNDVVIGNTPFIGLDDLVCYHGGSHE